jgi:hypothetical protein
MGDFDLVESPSGIGTELPWQLRWAYGPPTLHSLFTVSQRRPHTIFFETHGLLYSYDKCECSVHDFCIVESHCLQIRGAWLPVQSVCAVSNSDNFNLSVTSLFVTDMLLLLIMLVGLLRLHLHIFGLGKLLWKQVGGATSRPLRSLMRFPCERV